MLLLLLLLSLLFVVSASCLWVRFVSGNISSLRPKKIVSSWHVARYPACLSVSRLKITDTFTFRKINFQITKRLNKVRNTKRHFNFVSFSVSPAARLRPAGGRTEADRSTDQLILKLRDKQWNCDQTEMMFWVLNTWLSVGAQRVQRVAPACRIDQILTDGVMWSVWSDTLKISCSDVKLHQTLFQDRWKY